MRQFALALLLTSLLQGAGVTVRFDPLSPEVGPFPTDALTVRDAAQKTGKRVNLPLPDCRAQPSTCQEIGLLNQLDGFNLTPRIVLRFSGPVQPDSIRDGVFLFPLENLTDEEYGLQRDGDVITMNQVIFDPVTNTAYAKPDSFIDQHRRFLLVVTSAVVDRADDPVAADAAYSACVANVTNEYCAALAQGIQLAGGRFGTKRIVSASVFTTESATAFMESARIALQSSTIDFQRTGAKNTFGLAEIAQATLRQQTRTSPVGYEDQDLPVNLLSGIRAVSFASFRSPNFLRAQLIPNAPTGATVALPPDSTQIFFHAFIPASAKPTTGYPVVIFGHGIGDNRFFGPSAMASTLAGAGIAMVAFNAVGHGFGPESQFVVRTNSGITTVVPAPGRGVDVDGNGVIDDREGCIVYSPVALGVRDCLRQTALDQMQLVRAIQAGIDMDGDGTIDFDPNKIYYVGQSLGAMYGTLFGALEPAVPASVLNVGGGSTVDVARFGSALSLGKDFLGMRVPSLLNKGNDFDENYVLRYLPAKVNTVAGAIEIQNYLERIEWVTASGDPLSYAPHLKSSTLPGMPIKSILWTFGRGDRTVPNNTQTALVRAANMHENTWMYRHDLALAAGAQVPTDPHVYMLNVLTLPTFAIALSAQTQAAGFLASGGAVIPNPNSSLLRSLFGVNLFEIPSFLPEDRGF
jgi:pimeloyl-ACP methyl ester carboxylesterase